MDAKEMSFFCIAVLAKDNDIRSALIALPCFAENAEDAEKSASEWCVERLNEEEPSAGWRVQQVSHTMLTQIPEDMYQKIEEAWRERKAQLESESADAGAGGGDDPDDDEEEDETEEAA